MSLLTEAQAPTKEGPKEFFPELHIVGSVPVLRTKPKLPMKGYAFEFLDAGDIDNNLFSFKTEGNLVGTTVEKQPPRAVN